MKRTKSSNITEYMKKKICFVVAIAETAQAFLRDHLTELSKDYNVFLVGNIKQTKDVEMLSIKGFHHIDILRKISPYNDLKATWQLYKYFRKMQFDAVHSVTPKAGLICALASFFVRVPQRTHIFTGQVWATAHGFKRFLLKFIDILIAKLDNHIIVDGHSQRAFLIKERVIKKEKSEVFAQGSICGVNTSRFNPSNTIRKKQREKLNIHDNTIVFMLMGRMNHDKGVGDLMQAYNQLAQERNDTFLLLVGMEENKYLSTLPIYKNITDKNYKYLGQTHEPQAILQAADVFILPTYREGFGSSILEASCTGLPIITSDVYGVMDAIVENETGLRCHVGNIESIYQCMKYYCEHPEKRKEHGHNGRERVLKYFAGEVLTEYWKQFYHRILQ